MICDPFCILTDFVLKGVALIPFGIVFLYSIGLFIEKIRNYLRNIKKQKKQ